MSAVARFDRVARPYRCMEYFTFGPYLQKCRRLRISEMISSRSVLVYGDGDGRFLAELARSIPKIPITAIDASRAMLHQVAQRLPEEADTRLVHADALECDARGLRDAPFDLIVTHFFLDCFNETELALLLLRVNAAAAERAMWVVSEFAIPPSNPTRLLAALVVRSLYLGFGLLTGLKTRRLPDYGRVMRKAGWVLENQRESLFGLLVSERWRRRDSHGTNSAIDPT
jgi:ubiquinone/menaquinone biosynthesis C-methylase UbiE